MRVDGEDHPPPLVIRHYHPSSPNVTHLDPSSLNLRKLTQTSPKSSKLGQVSLCGCLEQDWLSWIAGFIFLLPWFHNTHPAWFEGAWLGLICVTLSPLLDQAVSWRALLPTNSDRKTNAKTTTARSNDTAIPNDSFFLFRNTSWIKSRFEGRPDLHMRDNYLHGDEKTAKNKGGRFIIVI